MALDDDDNVAERCQLDDGTSTVGTASLRPPWTANVLSDRARSARRQSWPWWSSTPPGRGSMRPSRVLASQDYPALSTVFLLADGADDDTAARIRAVLPEAFVEALGANPGFGPAANTVAQIVEGDQGFFCFCHDDVALDPDADPADGRGAVPLQRRDRRAEARDVGPPQVLARCRPRRRPLRATGQPRRRRRGRSGTARRSDRRVRRPLGVLLDARRPVPRPRWLRRGDELPRRGRRPLLARPHQRRTSDRRSGGAGPSPRAARVAAPRPQPRRAACPPRAALDVDAHCRLATSRAVARDRRAHRRRGRRRRVQRSCPRGVGVGACPRRGDPAIPDAARPARRDRQASAGQRRRGARPAVPRQQSLGVVPAGPGDAARHRRRRPRERRRRRCRRQTLARALDGAARHLDRGDPRSPRSPAARSSTARCRRSASSSRSPTALATCCGDFRQRLEPPRARLDVAEPDRSRRARGRKRAVAVPHGPRPHRHRRRSDPPRRARRLAAHRPVPVEPRAHRRPRHLRRRCHCCPASSPRAD